MQSTGHSSIQALSLMSTQGSAIVYVTKVSSMCCSMWLLSPRVSLPGDADPLITDTRRCIYKSSTGPAMRAAAVQLVAYVAPRSLCCPRGATPRDLGVVVRTVRLRLRAGAPVRPLDRVLLECHPSADLPHPADDGRRRLGVRNAGGPARPAGQEGLHRLRHRPRRTRPMDRRAANRTRRRTQGHPYP